MIENQEVEEEQRGGGGEGKQNVDEYVMTQTPPHPASSQTGTTSTVATAAVHGETLYEPL